MAARRRNRARRPADYGRDQPRQEIFERILIVCEGKKTEPNYFNGLKREHNLTSVEVSPHIGKTDPRGIARHALDVLKKTDDWDRVYCVFDGDRTEHLSEALNLLSNTAPGKAGRVFAIMTNPCFEFWILLHYIYSAKGYSRTAQRTPCEAVIRDLSRHIPKYAKGDSKIYDAIRLLIPTAVTYAKRLAKEQSDTGVANPSTKAHLLVEHLLNLRRGRRLD